MSNDKFALVVVGKDSWIGYFPTTTQNDFSAVQGTGEADLSRAADDAIVIDLRPINDIITIAMNLPKVGMNLVYDQVDIFPQPWEQLKMAGSDSALNGLIAYHCIVKLTNDLGPLDKVSPTAYRDTWSKHGALIGSVKEGKVIWQ